jgi:hypothetical protein
MVCINKDYDVSDHVIDYMNKGECSIQDIEYCIQNATTINGMNKDEEGDSVDGILYTIKGTNIAGLDFYTTGKFKESTDSKEIYFFVTAHNN